MHFESSLLELNWNSEIALEYRIKDNINPSLFNKGYWQTRQRQKQLRLCVVDYIVAEALEEASDLICHRLDEISRLFPINKTNSKHNFH